MVATPKPILLATDDPNDVFTFWAYHKQCGVHNRVEVFSDGEDVLRYLEGTRLNLPFPALLVLGLNMPRTGGLNVLERLPRRDQRPFPAVLLIDARDHDMGLGKIACRLGAEAFLTRPISKKDFYSIMSLFPETVWMDDSSWPNIPAQPPYTPAAATPTPPPAALR